MFEIQTELPEDSEAIEALLDAAFGRDRLKKSSYSYRHGIPREAGLCLVARIEGRVVGTIRFWPIAIGPTEMPALLLGPVAVDGDLRSLGIGAALVRQGLALAETAGHEFVMLVGDAPYYQRFGFQPAAQWGIAMASENPSRVLALPLGASLPPNGGWVRRCSQLATHLVGDVVERRSRHVINV